MHNKFNISKITIHEDGFKILFKNIYDGINCSMANYMYKDIKYIVSQLQSKYDLTQDYIIGELMNRIILSEKCNEFDNFTEVVWYTLSELLHDRNYYKFMTKDIFFSAEEDNTIVINNDSDINIFDGF
jgi:hypothetical protein